MDVNEALLPGVGLRYEFLNSDGQRVAIVAKRGGDFDVVAYSADDPDRGRPVLRLTPQEADTVAEILGAARIAERFADLTREVPGLSAGQLEVSGESPYASATLGATRARTRTGASIAVGAGTKVLTGRYAAGRDGAGVRGKRRAGTALIARGEFSIVIIGLAGFGSSALGPVVTAYVLMLAIAGPLLTRFVEREPEPT